MTDPARRTVMVTGGSRGLGRAICLAFSGPDTHICFNYNAAEDSAAETARLITAAGGSASYDKVDVASSEQVGGFVKKTVREHGGLHVLVNNAGITRDGLVVMMKEKDWDDVIETNLKGAFNCIKAATRPMMKQRYGRIVNITSVVGVMGNPGQANYSASKAGIIGLTKSLARELASRNITVNAVAPGYVETDMTASLPDKAKEAMLAMIPLGRAGTPEEIAGLVEFLASDKGAYITGQVVHISGGMYT
ncbi:MAG: 3-oxoacyl-[acyl-carrier-protein] reductase [Deltaproteobacteria bacterium]|nr:3-oxoacyl-[acyl-carrier-protein] reductase [Deltaproteobacteria bacterium]MBW2175911.1 3-oxoacyl-[acyl-carrier-protein] reductase [Deltaproteobacteria bacterium]MBW2296903.1 3-oxoacyl-[acyl-carrier-protein] reductase [Deltaproteobacteria bacterium]